MSNPYGYATPSQQQQQQQHVLPPTNIDPALEGVVKNFMRSEKYARKIKYLVRATSVPGRQNYKFAPATALTHPEMRMWRNNLIQDEIASNNPFWTTRWMRVFGIAPKLDDSLLKVPWIKCERPGTNDGDARSAVPLHRKETYLDLRDEQNRNWAMDSFAAGIDCAQKGQLDDAIKAYTQAIQIDSKCVEAYVARGCTFANIKKWRAAIMDFRAALNLDPNNSSARQYLEATMAQEEEYRLNPSMESIVTAAPANQPDTATFNGNANLDNINEIVLDTDTLHQADGGVNKGNNNERKKKKKKSKGKRRKDHYDGSTFKEDFAPWRISLSISISIPPWSFEIQITIPSKIYHTISASFKVQESRTSALKPTITIKAGKQQEEIHVALPARGRSQYRPERRPRDSKEIKDDKDTKGIKGSNGDADGKDIGNRKRARSRSRSLSRSRKSPVQGLSQAQDEEYSPVLQYQTAEEEPKPQRIDVCDKVQNMLTPKGQSSDGIAAKQEPKASSEAHNDTRGSAAAVDSTDDSVKCRATEASNIKDVDGVKDPKANSTLTFSKGSEPSGDKRKGAMTANASESSKLKEIKSDKRQQSPVEGGRRLRGHDSYEGRGRRRERSLSPLRRRERDHAKNKSGSRSRSRDKSALASTRRHSRSQSKTRDRNNSSARTRSRSYDRDTNRSRGRVSRSPNGSKAVQRVRSRSRSGSRSRTDRQSSKGTSKDNAIARAARSRSNSRGKANGDRGRDRSRSHSRSRKNRNRSRTRSRSLVKNNRAGRSDSKGQLERKRTKSRSPMRSGGGGRGKGGGGGGGGGGGAGGGKQLSGSNRIKVSKDFMEQRKRMRMRRSSQSRSRSP
ncbi:hypothetical protein BGX28_001415 [Mortierella sp. GBA30]|nr:hypothetical protein BGX28_001415 [Mortierella sp. GBA30]